MVYDQTACTAVYGIAEGNLHGYHPFLIEAPANDSLAVKVVKLTVN